MPSGSFALVPAHPKGPGKTSYPLLAPCSRRHLLRTQKWLSLAAFAPRLPSLVCRLLPFQEIPSERVVAPHPQRAARSSEQEGGKDPRPTAAIMDSQSVKTVE